MEYVKSAEDGQLVCEEVTENLPISSPAHKEDHAPHTGSGSDEPDPVTSTTTGGGTGCVALADGRVSGETELSSQRVGEGEERGNSVETSGG